MEGRLPSPQTVALVWPPCLSSGSPPFRIIVHHHTCLSSISNFSHLGPSKLETGSPVELKAVKYMAFGALCICEVNSNPLKNFTKSFGLDFEIFNSVHSTNIMAFLQSL